MLYLLFIWSAVCSAAFLPHNALIAANYARASLTVHRNSTAIEGVFGTCSSRGWEGRHVHNGKCVRPNSR